MTEAIRTLLNGIMVWVRQQMNKKVDKVPGKGLFPNDLADALRAKIETQADWNEMDPASPAYVKNRPFYSGVVYDYVYYHGPGGQSGQGSYVLTQSEENRLIPGETYTVTVNGVPEEIVCQTGADIGIESRSDWPYLVSKGGDEIHKSIYQDNWGNICAWTWWPSSTTPVKIQGPANVLRQLPLALQTSPVSGTGEYAEIFNHNPAYTTTASGDSSHAEGQNTDASGDSSHAEGCNTTASGDYSHAEGQNTDASGDRSHAEGDHTTASGISSHAEGEDTTASGGCSHAEGAYTTAFGNFQHVQGRCNIPDKEGKYLHIVGNGDFNHADSNAHTLDWSGNTWYQGRARFGGTGWDDAAAQEAFLNGDKALLLASSTEGSTKIFRLTVDDTGTIAAAEVTA